MFFGFCDPKSRFFDRKLSICLPYHDPGFRVTPSSIDSRIGASEDTFTTLGDTSAHVEKVHLRRIVSDFLTVRNRVGVTTQSPRMTVRGEFLPQRVAKVLDITIAPPREESSYVR